MSSMQYPNNDVPRMQDIIHRKVNWKQILYANLISLYRLLPLPVERIIHNLRHPKEKINKNVKRGA